MTIVLRERLRTSRAITRLGFRLLARGEGPARPGGCSRGWGGRRDDGKVGDSQVLVDDEVVAVHEAPGEVVVQVAALLGDLGVHRRHPGGGFAAPLRTPLAACDQALAAASRSAERWK